jgi:hypothetical protein
MWNEGCSGTHDVMQLDRLSNVDAGSGTHYHAIHMATTKGVSVGVGVDALMSPPGTAIIGVSGGRGARRPRRKHDDEREE